MKIGYAKVDITPDVGSSLAGYIGERISIGVHQPLYAKALVLKRWRKTYLWLSLDIIAVDHLFLVQLKQELKKHHFQFEDIEVFATHTHSGPCGTIDSGALASVFGSPDTTYISKIARKSVHAVKEAMLDFARFKVRVAQRDLVSFAASRHRKDLTIPNTLTTILVSREKKKEDILLYHFACHPTILHNDNVEISSDFVGGIELGLQKQYPNAMFLNGSCGNISTRFTREVSNKEEVTRMSMLVVEQILTALQDAELIDVPNYKAYHFSYDLKKKKMDTLEEAEARLAAAKEKLASAKLAAEEAQDLRLLESYVEGAQANYQLAKYDDGSTTQEIHLSIIKLGVYAVICIPAELFHSLEENIAYEHCLVVNYANGYHAYIADEAAYEQQYYEAMVSYYAKGEGEKLIAYINQKLASL